MTEAEEREENELIHFYQDKVLKLEEENEQLKAYESHWDEIEEDAKRIAEENAELKEKLKGFENGEVVFIGHYEAVKCYPILKERFAELEKENADLKAQKFEFEVQLQDITTQRNLANEQVETLEEELQSERYNLKCRDDELAEMKAKLRRAETKMRLAAEDYFEATDRVPGYFQALEERARKQEDLEDECAEDKAAAIRQEKEDGLLD